MSLNTSRFNSVLVTLQLWPHFHSLLAPYRCVLLFRTFSRINLGFFLLVFFSLAKKPINQSLRQIQPEQMKWNIFLTVICFFCWLCFVFFLLFIPLVAVEDKLPSEAFFYVYRPSQTTVPNLTDTLTIIYEKGELPPKKVEAAIRSDRKVTESLLESYDSWLLIMLSTLVPNHILVHLCLNGSRWYSVVLYLQ